MNCSTRQCNIVDTGGIHGIDDIGTDCLRARHHGFSLIELMITVALVSILSAVAIPQYVNYTTRAFLSDATAGLAVYRIRLEQYYQDNREYGASTGTACGVPAPALDRFTVTCLTSSSGQAYTATAAGKTGTPVAAFTYAVDYTGARSMTAAPAGWGTMPLACWITRKGATC